MNIPFTSRETSPSDFDELGTPYTDSLSLRYDWLNSAIALALVLPFVIAVFVAGMGELDLRAIPSDLRFAWITFTGIAIVWVFGIDAVQAWRGEKSTTVTETVFDDNLDPERSVERTVVSSVRRHPRDENVEAR